MRSGCPTILIVDDEEAIRKLLSIAFRAAGYAVRTAGSGAEAIGLCESEAFDVLLSDIRMPGMNGHELSRWVVTRRPNTIRILMSGYDGLGCQGCGVPSQPCAMLAKPFRPKEVVRMVDGMLAGPLPA